MGDHLVGQAVEAFKEYSQKVEREWLIVFVCGDHGWRLGENGIDVVFKSGVSQCGEVPLFALFLSI